MPEAAKSKAKSAPEPTPPTRPPRKHPWLLAIITVGLLAWFAFLAAMAFWT